LSKASLVAKLGFGGWVKVFLGEPDVVVERLAHVMRLSPLD